jgi:hypothetical protein
MHAWEEFKNKLSYFAIPSVNENPTKAKERLKILLKEYEFDNSFIEGVNDDIARGYSAALTIVERRSCEPYYTDINHDSSKRLANMTFNVVSLEVPSPVSRPTLSQLKLQKILARYGLESISVNVDTAYGYCAALSVVKETVGSLYHGLYISNN